METIGQRVKAERKALRLTQKQLGDAVGLKGETIRDLELGRMHTTTKLHRIADVFGVSVSWLETGKGAKQRSQVSEPAVNYDVRQARAVRPDPVTMASAYAAVVAVGFKYGWGLPRMVDLKDLELICEAYVHFAQGGRLVLPGEGITSELEALIVGARAQQGERSDGKSATRNGDSAAGGKR